MNKLLLAIVLTAASGPVLAQSGQTPPSPNASSASPAPANSAPRGALTDNPTSSRNPNVTGGIGDSTQAPSSQGDASRPSASFQNTVPRPTTR